MNFKKYTIPALTLLALVVFVYLFTNVVVYLIISVVLTLLGLPVATFISNIKIGKLTISDGMAAFLTLGLFFMIIYSLGITCLPPFIEQISFLSTSNLKDVLHNVLTYYPSLQNVLSSFGTEDQMVMSVTHQVNQFLNFHNVSSVFNNILSYTGTILGGLFSVLFITFFFLKDRKLVSNIVLLITPSDYEVAMNDILRTSKKMLSRYFAGLFMDIFLVSLMVSVLMWLLGIKNALVIGCVAGIMNIIPYIGPIVTLFFAVFLGVSGCIEYNHYELILPTMTKIVTVLVGVNLLDGLLLQPVIFSNTVKAHPLEVFIVILMAGAIGGISGMVVAIPGYTLLRIMAREFLAHFKFFKKLTQHISE